MKKIKDKNGYYHIVYRTHNIINGKEYTGKHSTQNLNDNYYGSGARIVKSIRDYGLENFAVEILSFHNNEIEALLKEEEIVDEEYIWRDDTYNTCLGGGFNWFGMATVKDKNGNIFQVSKYDPDYLSGELVGHTKNRGVFNINGKNKMLNLNDKRIKKLNLSGATKGSSPVKDKNGNTMSVSVDDPRIKSGELVHHTKYTTTVKDKNGNTMSVSVDDPRIKSGELVGITKGYGVYKDKNGNRKYLNKNDQRIRSGEYSYYNKGLKRKIQTVQCPYCKKIGALNRMNAHHFNNCKFKN